MIVPLLLAAVFLSAQIILIVLAISPSRPYLRAPIRSSTSAVLPRRGGTPSKLAVDTARRAGDMKTRARLCIGQRSGSSVRFLSFLPRGER